MTEAEVREAALQMFDPESSPRVHLVRLVRFGAFDRQIRAADTEGNWLSWFEQQSEPEADRPTYVVVASGDDIDLIGLKLSERWARGTPLPPVDHLDPPERVALVAIFDAVTGREGAVRFVWSGQSDLPHDHRLVQQVARLPTIEIDESRSAELRLTPPPTSTERPPAPEVSTVALPSTPTATPTVPLPPEGAVALDTEALDHVQTSAIAEFPLRPGARWIYRSVNKDYYRWETVRITTEVESGWRLDDGALLWRVRTVATRMSPSPVGPWPGPTPAPASGYSVFGNGQRVFAFRDGTFYESDNWEGVPASEARVPEIASLPPLAWWPLLRLPLEPGGPWFIGESWTGDPPTDYAGYSMIGRMRVTVPAGTFDDCAVLRLPIGAGATEWRWFCSGIGFVRQEGYGNNPGNFAATVELVEFVPGR